MPLYPSEWRKGHPPALFNAAAAENPCAECRGRGAYMTQHGTFTGSSYMPCARCNGTGEEPKPR
jgi:DnaJ-class molecular chaperone